jgi:hypothetical protein
MAGVPDLAERLAERHDLSFLDADAAGQEVREEREHDVAAGQAGAPARPCCPSRAVVLAGADDEAGRDRADLGALRAIRQVEAFVPVAAAAEVHAPREAEARVIAGSGKLVVQRVADGIDHRGRPGRLLEVALRGCAARCSAQEKGGGEHHEGAAERNAGSRHGRRFRGFRARAEWFGLAGVEPAGTKPFPRETVNALSDTARHSDREKDTKGLNGLHLQDGIDVVATSWSQFETTPSGVGSTCKFFPRAQGRRNQFR